ncbi:hypothetical protein DPX16_14629 [Anabarilius grahami]|uniref:Uncharacterized protein n=1 Tax=Anabarilius grahami TaxID=495550 RepID=A0A3N0YZK9_ANAGA|nr:hypothetical protein DPX16_14629 [Anabarilius grahami]
MTSASPDLCLYLDYDSVCPLLFLFAPVRPSLYDHAYLNKTLHLDPLPEPHRHNSQCHSSSTDRPYRRDEYDPQVDHNVALKYQQRSSQLDHPL